MNKIFSKSTTFLFVYGSLLPGLILLGAIVTWHAASAHLGRPPVASLDDPKEIADNVTVWANIFTSLILVSGMWLLPFYPFLFSYRLYKTIKNYRRWSWYGRLLILMPIAGLILFWAVNGIYFKANSSEIWVWFMD